MSAAASGCCSADVVKVVPKGESGKNKAKDEDDRLLNLEIEVLQTHS